MATLQERVSILEAKVDEHAGGIGEVRASIRSLDAKLDQRFDALSGRIDALDQKIDRFREELAGQIHGQIGPIHGQIHALDQKISRHFLWLAGFQLTTLLAIIGFLSR